MRSRFLAPLARPAAPRRSYAPAADGPGDLMLLGGGGGGSSDLMLTGAGRTSVAHVGELGLLGDVAHTHPRVGAGADGIFHSSRTGPTASDPAPHPASHPGTFVLKVIPGEATIAVDGVVQGTQEVRVDVAPGPHTVRFEAPGYESRTVELTAFASRLYAEAFTLTPLEAAPTDSPTPSPTASATPSPTASATPSPTASATPSPSSSPTASPAPSPTGARPSATPSLVRGVRREAPRGLGARALAAVGMAAVGAALWAAVTLAPPPAPPKSSPRGR